MAFQNRLAEVESLVRQIPSGRVTSYGAVGRMLEQPLSGLLVGRILRSADIDCPWWRVVGADGTLPLDRRGPEFGAEQRRRLAEEGVELVDERVPSGLFWRFGE